MDLSDEPGDGENRHAGGSAGAVERPRQTLIRLCHGAVTVLAAALGGGLGEISGLPAGPLVGAMVLVGGYNVWTDGRAQLPPWSKQASRMLAGTVIGSLVTAQLIAELGRYFPWVMVGIVSLICGGLIAGWLLSRLTRLPLPVCLLACAPGGLPEMAALADDLGSHAEIVVAVQVIRKVVALVVISLAVLVIAK